MPISRITRTIILAIAFPSLGLAQADTGLILDENQEMVSSSKEPDSGLILDPAHHPATPKSAAIYPKDMLSIDATLSWTSRFNGDETFNETVRLFGNSEQSTVATTSASKNVEESKSGASNVVQMDSAGMVKSIKAEQNKVKIDHRPIDKFGMPAMTMVFKVSEASMLEGLENGDEVDFNVDSTSGGFVITSIKRAEIKLESGADNEMDAMGTVKTIRMDQEKVKISHGPIEKFGMPEMSMMFKVSDPSMLEGLTKGSIVEFDIESTSGGFVITNINTVGE